MTKQTYRVDAPIKIGGEIIKPGKSRDVTVDLTDDQSRTLLATGSVSRIAPRPQDLPPGGLGNEKLDAFRAALSKLDPENDEHWLKDRRPDLKALEAAGLKLQRKEADALFALVQAELEKEPGEGGE